MTGQPEQAEGAKTIKVNKWDGAAVKNALDDAVKEVLIDKLQYTESFALIDGRLAICTLAVGIAGFALVWDYLNPFPLSEMVLLCCVLGYFFLMGILTLYTTYIEKGIFLSCYNKDDMNSSWKASSAMKKYDDKYELVLTFVDGKTKKPREITSSRSVGQYFDDNGALVMDQVENEVTKMHNSLLTGRKVK